MVSVPLYKSRKSITVVKENHDDDVTRARRQLRNSYGYGYDSSSSSSMNMYGALSDDYAAQIVVNGIPMNINIDTGSVAFAVAGHPDIGCDSFIDTTELISQGRCDTTHNITSEYGTGWWTGIMCNMTVAFGTPPTVNTDNNNDNDDDEVVSPSVPPRVTNYSVGVMLDQRQMTTCARTPDDDPTSISFRENKNVYMEGIAGFAFPDPRFPFYHPVLMQLFFGTMHPEIVDAHDDSENTPEETAATNGEKKIQPIFGLQSCGYEPILGTGGNGALDLGRFDPNHYEGPIQWTRVEKARYWGVHMTAVRLGYGSSSSSPTLSDESSTTKTQSPNLLPERQRTALDEDGNARTIVDSGTSMALFDPDTFESIVQTLKVSSNLPKAKDLPDEFFTGEACVSLDDVDITKWPPLVLEFARGIEDESSDIKNESVSDDNDPIVLTIPACRYVELVPPGWCVGNAPATRSNFPHDQPAYSFAVGKMPPNKNALLGQVLFEQYYVAHDMTPGKERIGFAPLAGCDPTAICIDGYASPGIVQQNNDPSQTNGLMLFWGCCGLAVLTASIVLIRKKLCTKRGYDEIVDVDDFSLHTR